mgnify:CR=1 FL=1
MNFRRQMAERSPGFQMAPMVDIIFLLLIFFIASAVYSQWERKLEIVLPTARAAKEAPRFLGEAIINIDAEGKIFLNSIEYTPDRLLELLRQLATTFPDQPVVVRADRATRYADVIRVLDLCRQADIANLAFATLPEGAPAGAP